MIFGWALAHAADATSLPPLKLAPRPVRVRNLNGSPLCELPAGTQVQPTGRTADGDEIQIKSDVPGCTSGFIDVREALRANADPSQPTQAVVDENGLALRSSPRVSDASYRCSLPEGTPLELLPDEKKDETARWTRVKLKSPLRGCSTSEGWVSSSYLRPDQPFEKLPVIRPDPRRATEADACPACEERERQAALLMQNGGALEQKAGEGPPGQSPFITEVQQLSRSRRCQRQSSYRCNRGLIQMPLVGRNAGFCGTHHYTPDRPPGVDAYAEPMTACSLVALAQEWKQSHCPQRSGCTIEWGDISHRSRPRFNGHAEHKDGECIDIRPMRKGGFQDAGLNYRTRDYDREKTLEFIALARKLGARKVIFNDPRVHAVRAGGHNNHVHICFGNNAKTRATCQNLQVHPNVCPELQ